MTPWVNTHSEKDLGWRRDDSVGKGEPDDQNNGDVISHEDQAGC